MDAKHKFTGNWAVRVVNLEHTKPANVVFFFGGGFKYRNILPEVEPTKKTLSLSTSLIAHEKTCEVPLARWIWGNINRPHSSLLYGWDFVIFGVFYITTKWIVWAFAVKLRRFSTRKSFDEHLTMFLDDLWFTCALFKFDRSAKVRLLHCCQIEKN